MINSQLWFTWRSSSTANASRSRSFSLSGLSRISSSAPAGLASSAVSSYSRASTAIFRAQSYVSGWIRVESSGSTYVSVLLHTIAWHVKTMKHDDLTETKKFVSVVSDHKLMQSTLTQRLNPVCTRHCTHLSDSSLVSILMKPAQLMNTFGPMRTWDRVTSWVLFSRRQLFCFSVYTQHLYCARHINAFCFHLLHQLGHIRHSLDPESMATLEHAFVTSCVHYCNTEHNNEQTTALLHMSSATPRSMTKDCHISRISSYTDSTFLSNTLQAHPPGSQVSACQDVGVLVWLLYTSCRSTTCTLRGTSPTDSSTTSPQHMCGCQTFSVAGSMTFNGLSDQLCNPSVNTATFTRLKTYFSRYKHVQCIRGADVMHYIKHYKLLKEWFQ